MPTIFAHAAVGWSIARAWPRARDDGTLRWTAAALAMLPDADALFLRWVDYGAVCGHRGLTHGLAFAAAVSGLASWGLVRRTARTVNRRSTFALIFVAVASHGILDAFTNGGMGIAFFSPFVNDRYFMPWTPIPVAPLSARAMLTRAGAELLAWEAILFGPFVAAAALARPGRRKLVTGLLALGVLIWVVVSVTEPTRLQVVRGR